MKDSTLSYAVHDEDDPRRRARKTCLVTGATSGIGFAVARGLARAGLDVIVAYRDPLKGVETARAIQRDSGRFPGLLCLDLARRASVKTAAYEVVRDHGAIDVLVNNAGMWSSVRRESPDGVELTWAVNVLGHHLLTRLLSEGGGLGRRARVVNVASGLARGLVLSDVGFERRRYSGLAAYAQSKQANRMLTRAHARRFERRQVSVNAMHPGFTRTPAFSSGGGVQGWIAGCGARLFGKDPSKGADTALWLATSRDVAGVSGGYFVDRRSVPCEHANERDEEALYDLCERMTEPQLDARTGDAGTATERAS